jgi:hypothetical protein
MNIFERLPQKDVELLHKYICWYGGTGDGSDGSGLSIHDMPYFLRYWTAAKTHLYKMFGEQFIIKQEVCFEKNGDELAEDMDGALLCGRDQLITKFITEYVKKIDQLDMLYEDRYQLKRFIRDVDMLVSNIYDGDPITIPGTFTVDGRPLQINEGGKAVKMLGKIVKALDLDCTMYKCPVCGRYHINRTERCENCDYYGDLTPTEGYETFRRAHSLVLNQKKIKGNLCLSIHPLDYLTMSDNWSGWSSCMQWMEEAGDYRLGTIEMMNSDYIVVAYVEAKDDMTLCNGSDTWNNKRWRQLLVITPDLILGNKQYPYNNDILQGTALKWLRRLAEATGSFGPYDEEAVQIVNHGMNRIGTRDIYVNLTFSYMYNDIYDHRLAFINSNAKNLNLTLNLSGYAVCTSCGGTIYYDDVDPSWTVCRSCTGMWKCSHCGDWCSGEPYYVEDKDDPYCHFCYYNDTETCEICGDRVSETTKVYIELLPNPPADLVCFNWSYVIDSCWHCLEYGEFERYFGPAKTVSDMWGRLRKVVSIDTITDEGFELGTLGPSLARLLKEIRDTKSIEDRVDLIENKLC